MPTTIILAIEQATTRQLVDSPQIVSGCYQETSCKNCLLQTYGHCYCGNAQPR